MWPRRVVGVVLCVAGLALFVWALLATLGGGR